MVVDLHGVWDRVRQPAYTGENRCVPCTVVNVVLVLVVGVLVAIQSFPVAVGLVLIGFATIAVRGYVIPWTPTLTQRFLPGRVLAWFGKAPSVDVTTPDEFVAFGTDHELVEETSEDVQLTAAARTALADRIAALRDRSDERIIADQFDVDAAQVTTSSGAARFAVYVDEDRLTFWRSHEAFLADVAIQDLLADQIPHWKSMDRRERGAIVTRFRILLETCPGCDGTLEIERADGCCPGEKAVRLFCPDCEAVLLERSI